MVTLPSLLSTEWSRGGTHLPGRRTVKRLAWAIGVPLPPPDR
jgi:hypothetical protein